MRGLAPALLQETSAKLGAARLARIESRVLQEVSCSRCGSARLGSARKNARRCERENASVESRQVDYVRATRTFFTNPAVKQSLASSSRYFVRSRCLAARLLFASLLNASVSAEDDALFVTRRVNRRSFRISITSHYPNE